MWLSDPRDTSRQIDLKLGQGVPQKIRPTLRGDICWVRALSNRQDPCGFDLTQTPTNGPLNSNSFYSEHHIGHRW